MHVQPRGQRQPSFERYSSFYEKHADCFRADAACAAQRPGARQLSYEIAPVYGRGWTDMHEFGNGIMTGRMHWQLDAPLESVYAEYPDTLNLGLIADGRSIFRLAGQEDTVCEPGSIFLRNGNPGVFRNRAPSGLLMTGVSVDIPRELARALHEDGVDLAWIGRRDSHAILRPSQAMGATLRTMARRMLAVRTSASTLARLELESLSLELLLKLMAAGPGARLPALRQVSRRWQAALDEALDILHTEWQQPHTIAQLARRAGINECYLKSQFRERTGMGVAAYLRQLRMEHARELLAGQRHSIQQVAALCGYAHAGKFAKAFREAHGAPPSALV
jgi:AraC-like DNA-binding protein